MRLYTTTIAVSAFLLFQVQPLIARAILPYFGGTAAVWTTCLLFFQFALLAGYGYAHLTTQRLTSRMQCALHLTLIVLSVCVLRLTPQENWKPTGVQEPTLAILWLLTRTIGLPYLLLSTTSPLLQAWFVRQHAGRASPILPYRLYAVSNAGSLLALISYPVLVEPNFTLRQQAGIWSAGYLLFAVFCSVLSCRAAAAPVPVRSTQETILFNLYPETASEEPGFRQVVIWISLAFCGSTLLCAITNHLTENIAAIPFLWILPLSLYLISFIVCFAATDWQWRKPYQLLPTVATTAMIFAIAGHVQPIVILIPVFLSGLTICCLLCHGELARRKPASQYLTAYYLWTALGGSLGSLFVAVVAPRLFPDHWELPLAIGACALIAPLAIYRNSAEQPTNRSMINQRRALLFGLTGALLLWMGLNARQTLARSRVTVRNFYGVLHVTDMGPQGAANEIRVFTHGGIRHGTQFLRPDRRRLPTTYFGYQTGVGLTLRTLQQQGPLRVGIIGLGAGTLAAYGRSGDLFHFYEINPLVIRIARTEFTFLADTRATVQVTLGDGRLALEREPAQQFDLLIADAFSGDAIPIHLMTQEAFALYFHHLRPEGILAIQVSNRYLDLAPMVAAQALSVGRVAKKIHVALNEASQTPVSDWVIIAPRRSFFDSTLLHSHSEAILPNPDLRLWTDDYSSLLGMVKSGFHGPNTSQLPITR